MLMSVYSVKAVMIVFSDSEIDAMVFFDLRIDKHHGITISSENTEITEIIENIWLTAVSNGWNAPQKT